MEYARHPHATFCFAELHTSDVDEAARFYGELLGWTAVQVSGDFYLFRLRGRDVIAMRRVAGPQRLLGFVRVESVDRAATRAQELGGGVVTPPFDTPGFARTAVLEDPEGAAFGVWECRGHNGAQVQDSTGTMWWAELMSKDIAAMRPFYASLFGWTFGDTRKYGNDLTIFRSGEISACSALQYHPSWGVQPHWSVAFAIEDWEGRVRCVERLGGSLIFWRDVPHAGRLGIVEDCGGATFYMMRPDVVAT